MCVSAKIYNKGICHTASYFSFYQVLRDSQFVENFFIQIFPINVDSNTNTIKQSISVAAFLTFFPSSVFVRFVILPKPFSVVGCIVRFENVNWKVHCQIYVLFQFIFIFLCTMLNTRRRRQQRKRREEKGPSDFFTFIIF